MFQHITVPVDGSRHSEKALEYAAQLLMGSTGELSVVTVVPIYLAASFPGSKLPGTTELEDHHGRLAEEYVAAKAEEIETRTGVPAKAVTLKGLPAEEINEYATMTATDLIIISSRGITTSSAPKNGSTLGSVALRVMMTATCPVLLLRGSA
jgi:nucleotide-binding universal stress UspA family protein